MIHANTVLLLVDFVHHEGYNALKVVFADKATDLLTMQ
jgi:hypothetical protein